MIPIPNKLASSSVLTESKIENILDTQGFELDAATGGQDRQPMKWKTKRSKILYFLLNKLREFYSFPTHRLSNTL